MAMQALPAWEDYEVYAPRVPDKITAGFLIDLIPSWVMNLFAKRGLEMLEVWKTVTPANIEERRRRQGRPEPPQIQGYAYPQVPQQQIGYYPQLAPYWTQGQYPYMPQQQIPQMPQSAPQGQHQYPYMPQQQIPQMPQSAPQGQYQYPYMPQQQIPQMPQPAPQGQCHY